MECDGDPERCGQAAHLVECQQKLAAVGFPAGADGSVVVGITGMEGRIDQLIEALESIRRNGSIQHAHNVVDEVLGVECVGCHDRHPRTQMNFGGGGDLCTGCAESQQPEWADNGSEQ